MGGRLRTHQGVLGARFAVWAPHARCVSLIGDFNHWDGTLNPMRFMGASDVWELFVPGLKEGERYKFAIHTQEGQTLLKADSYASFSEAQHSVCAFECE
jgi:1,4-alpha-glucan branching enzyme